ncbi:hypothetical protein U27_03840 [Candidatus Vecturithrix granuli]|uniref:Uncharacterized protein n=1 Tax=Vecturithrix granuli TaxID=1499967 RepID=A0A081BX21_VECG1|nr:hypothetical protein U27_03840 [Candidatus Vecturithrix granuli]
MKKFFGFLVHLFIILLELAICAFLVFYLISHPIIKQDGDSIMETRSPNSPDSSGSSDLPTGSTRLIAARPVQASLYIPPVIWVPEYFAPEKQWGYDRVYSCTRLERVPGFWHIPGSQPPISPHFPMYIFDECTMRYF